MAVSRTFIRGINCSAFSSSLLRSSTSGLGAVGSSNSGNSCGQSSNYCTSATTTQQASSIQASKRGFPAVAGPSSQPWAQTSPCSTTRQFGTSARTRKGDDPQRLRDLRFDQDQLDKQIPKDDPGHDMTGDEGRHRTRTLKSFSLKGKVCVVTGAARGLGNVMARGFIESGADQVAFVDLSEEDTANAIKDVRAWFEEENGKKSADKLDLLSVSCNIAKEQSVKDAFSKIHKHFGRINVVVNSAGIVDNAPAEDYSTERFKKLMDINMDGSWFVATEAGRYMMQDKTQDGSIILVASMSASIVNVPQLQTPYNVSKAGVKHLAACLGVEWAMKNIRVNAISPGYFLTSLTKAMTEKSELGRQLRAAWESKIPCGRMGDPDELKGAAVFLASDASRYVTATDLVVDGGYCAV